MESLALQTQAHIDLGYLIRLFNATLYVQDA